MSETTERLTLPFIIPGQAQKEFYHNEALIRIDAALHAAAEEAPVTSPPQGPEPGQCWIVAPAATGEWEGQDHTVAAWTDAGWRFVAPPPGMIVWNKAGGYWLHFDGADWADGAMPARSILVDGQQVLGPRQAAMPSPSGGTTIDVEARAAIDQITAALMSHGLIG